MVAKSLMLRLTSMTGIMREMFQLYTKRLTLGDALSSCSRQLAGFLIGSQNVYAGETLLLEHISWKETWHAMQLFLTGALQESEASH